MTKIIGVRFKPVGKMYYFDPMEFEIKRGDNVIVETSRGMEYGEVILGIREVEDSSVTKPLKGVLRLATDEDTLQYNENKEKEKEAYSICVEKIAKHNLEMKLIEVEYAFDRNKILFYFTADGRVDFRELVKDLAAVFRTRIELRQIGVRDESKTRGSIGICGRNLCCSQFLEEFMPVSIKMAKEQGLSLNPSKISGVCGRLMCCLKYEQDTYEELIAESPKAGARVMTPDGEGTVMNVALLRGKVRVRMGGEDDMSHKDYDVSEVKIIDSRSADNSNESDEYDEELIKELIDDDTVSEDKKEQRKRKQTKNNSRYEKKEENSNSSELSARNKENRNGKRIFKSKPKNKGQHKQL